jgi:serine/threonine-protein kinase
VVYRASHAMLRRATALKVLPLERAGKEAVARFEREVQLTCQLTHPNTITIYDYGRTPEGGFYYAMELLEGLDLQTLVERTGRLSPARAARILEAAAGALAEAHGVGLIHRDIKPSNIFLCRERGCQPDVAKVLDFGLVKRANEVDPTVSREGFVLGTPMYMAPESLCTGECDARSDLYALGGVAYFLLTGHEVFGNRTTAGIIAAQLHATPESPSDRLGSRLPAALECLVLACLAKDPSARPQSALSFIELLRQCEDLGSWADRDARAWWTKHDAPKIASRMQESSSSAA